MVRVDRDRRFVLVVLWRRVGRAADTDVACERRRGHAQRADQARTQEQTSPDHPTPPFSQASNCLPKLSVDTTFRLDGEDEAKDRLSIPFPMDAPPRRQPILRRCTAEIKWQPQPGATVHTNPSR